MRVVVIGAYGLVGSYVVAALLRAGHTVVAVGRDITAPRRRQPRAAWVAADLRTTAREDWAALLAGADALVNCAGALQDGARDDLEATHVAGLGRVLEGCRAAGVSRFVQVSALGLANSRTAFGTTKLAAEAMVAGAGLDTVILRPGLVLAPAAYGGSALLRGLAGCPLVVPLVAGAAEIQVVAAEDVAAAVLAALESPTAQGTTFDLAHARRLSLAEIVLSLRGWLGLPAAKVLTCPAPLVRLATGTGDLLGHLGWRSPIRSTTLDQLRNGIEGDGAAASRDLGVTLSSLDEMLSRHPAGVQDRWFARTYFLKPLALAVLALFWTLSGLIGILCRGALVDALAGTGIPSGVAEGFAILGALADIVLGIGVAVRRSAPAALVGMILVSGAYLLGLTALQPGLWLDPLGPLLKTAPAALAAAFALALMDER